MPKPWPRPDDPFPSDTALRIEAGLIGLGVIVAIAWTISLWI